MRDPIEAFFAGYPAEVQEISRRLRALVTDGMPQAGREQLFARHNHVGYSLGTSQTDSVCYICPMKEYARLGFMYGTHLADPDRLLVGTGERLRHVKVRSVEAASDPALKRLVAEAWVGAAESIAQTKQKHSAARQRRVAAQPPVARR